MSVEKEQIFLRKNPIIGIHIAYLQFLIDLSALRSTVRLPKNIPLFRDLGVFRRETLPDFCRIYLFFLYLWLFPWILAAIRGT